MSIRPSSDDALLAYSVLDGAPGPVFVLDRDWVVRYLNHASVSVLARGETASLVGQRLFDIVPELGMRGPRVLRQIVRRIHNAAALTPQCILKWAHSALT